MTNFEKIKSMSIEEMSDFICSIYNTCDFEEHCVTIIGNTRILGGCSFQIKEWLESEIDENA